MRKRNSRQRQCARAGDLASSASGTERFWGRGPGGGDHKLAVYRLLKKRNSQHNRKDWRRARMDAGE